MTVFVRRSNSVFVLADRICRLPATDGASMQSSARYDGARPCMHLNTVIASLKIIRWRTRSQCKARNTGVMWSYFWFLSRHAPQLAASGLAAAVVAGRRRCHTANCCSSQDDYWQTRAWASWLLLWSAMIGLAWADEPGRKMTGTVRLCSAERPGNRPGCVRLLKTGLWRITAAVQ